MEVTMKQAKDSTVKQRIGAFSFPKPLIFMLYSIFKC